MAKMKDKAMELEENLVKAARAYMSLGASREEVLEVLRRRLWPAPLPEMRHIVKYNDEDGIPRAWAYGEDLERVREEAKRQLELYVEEKRRLGWRMSVEDFGEPEETVQPPLPMK